MEARCSRLFLLQSTSHTVFYMYSSSSSSFFFPPPAVLSRLYCILPYPCIWEYGLQLLSVFVHLDFLLGLAADMSVCLSADQWAVLCDLYLYIIGVPHPPRVLWCLVEFICTELTSFDEKCQCKKNLETNVFFSRRDVPLFQEIKRVFNFCQKV